MIEAMKGLNISIPPELTEFVEKAIAAKAASIKKAKRFFRFISDILLITAVAVQFLAGLVA